MRLIDADALAKYFEGLAVSLANVECFAADATQTAAETLKLAPTIDAEPVRHGWWIARKHRRFDSEGRVVDYCDLYHCSECKNDRHAFPPHNYCPNCGAKMDLEVQDD